MKLIWTDPEDGDRVLRVEVINVGQRLCGLNFGGRRPNLVVFEPDDLLLEDRGTHGGRTKWFHTALLPALAPQHRILLKTWAGDILLSPGL